MLLPLLWEALIVSVLQLLIQSFNLGEWHPGHQFKLFRVDIEDFRVTTRECEDSASKIELVHIEEALLLYAEVCEELCIPAQVLAVLLGDFPSKFSVLRLLLLGYDGVGVVETALVDEYVDVIKNCVAEQLPIHGSKDFALLSDDGLIAVCIPSR